MVANITSYDCNEYNPVTTGTREKWIQTYKEIKQIFTHDQKKKKKKLSNTSPIICYQHW